MCMCNCAASEPSYRLAITVTTAPGVYVVKSAVSKNGCGNRRASHALAPDWQASSEYMCVKKKDKG